MATAIIFDIILLALLIAAAIMLNKTWNEKEKYRCRLFDLTNGKEGSHLVQAPDIPPPPAPQGLFPTRPLLTEWLHNNCGEYFRRKDVVAEIEKRIKETKSMQPKFDQFWAGQISAFKGVLKILDTLEVKEVDLDNDLFEEVYSHLDDIKDTADRMTSGNFMHHRAAIKYSANVIEKVLGLIVLK